MSNSGTDLGTDIQLIASNSQMDGASIITSPTEGSIGKGGDVTIMATGPASFNNSFIDTHSDVANGGGGAVKVSASDLTLHNTTIMTSVFGDGVTPVTSGGGGGAVTLRGSDKRIILHDRLSN